MNQQGHPSPLLCPDGHQNPSGSHICGTCSLPLISWESEVESVLETLEVESSHVVPHIDGCMVGVGSTGSRIVTDLCQAVAGEITGVSFLCIDSMDPQHANAPKVSRPIRFHRYTIGESAIGGMIYAGLGEENAQSDSGLEFYLQLSGIRHEDAGQVIFITAAMGGGTGSGAGPVVANLAKAGNPLASALTIAITPSPNEADHIHSNAYYGISQLVGASGTTPSTDMLVITNYERLRQIRGVGRSGQDLRADGVLIYLLRLLELNLRNAGIVRMCRISKGSKILTFVPCLAMGRSMEIFGNLGNVLESAGAYPLAKVDFSKIMASYLLLRIPSRLERDFPAPAVARDFEAWNREHVPAMRSSLVQIVQTEEQSDRIDACILLGGDDLSNILMDTLEKHRRFKAYVEKSSRWEEYGLSEQKVAEAEERLFQHDDAVRTIRETAQISGDRDGLE